MSGIRIYELSRELNVENKVLIDLLAGMGYPVKSHSSSIEFHLVDRLRRQVKLHDLGKKPPKRAAKAKAKPDEEASAAEEKVEAHVETPPEPAPKPVEKPAAIEPAPPVAAQPAPTPPPPVAAPVAPAAPEIKQKAPEPSPEARPEPRPTPPITPRPAQPGVRPQPGAFRPPAREFTRPQQRPGQQPSQYRQGQGQGQGQGQRPFRPDTSPGGPGGRPRFEKPTGGAPGQRPFAPRPVSGAGTTRPSDEQKPSRFQPPGTRAGAAKKGARGKDAHKKKRDGEPFRTEGEIKFLKAKEKIKLKEESKRRREVDEVQRKKDAEERELQKLIAEEEHAKAEAEAKRIVIDEATTVKEFAEKTRQSVNVIISKLISRGIMATLNQTIDVDMAKEMALELGMELKTRDEAEKENVVEEEEDKEKLVPRWPVVTIMGHVDHGKTSLLDTIRKTRVTETEAGGITQRVGAYMVDVGNKGKVVFLDTPGHEAFTALRARGASVTDIVVLVVAADDGVMPQTLEAIHHAEAAKVPVVVAINKMDKPGANPDRIKQDLTAHGLVAEEWGGTTIFCEVSAKKNIGIETLLEMILLQSEVLELRANPDRMASGVIIESKLDKGRGPVATVLVQRGSLKVGDAFVAGGHSGRVRALMDDVGKRVDKAGPSTPVEVLGFGGVPQAGEKFMVVENERKAHQIAMKRQEVARVEGLTSKGHVKLENLHAQISSGEKRDLNIIIKADLQGSIEAMRQALGEIKVENLRINILHSAVGGITETDVTLAAASDAIVIGFNVRPMEKAKALAEAEEVDVRLYGIIYNVIDDIKKALEGMLKPIFKEVVTGRAEVREVFNITGIGAIAGCSVQSGKIVRNSAARLVRDSVVVYTGKVTSLRRFKDDVREVASGYECGIGLEKYSDIKNQDIIETFESQEVARKEGA